MVLHSPFFPVQAEALRLCPQADGPGLDLSHLRCPCPQVQNLGHCVCMLKVRITERSLSATATRRGQATGDRAEKQEQAASSSLPDRMGPLTHLLPSHQRPGLSPSCPWNEASTESAVRGLARRQGMVSSTSGCEGPTPEHSHRSSLTDSVAQGLGMDPLGHELPFNQCPDLHSPRKC